MGDALQAVTEKLACWPGITRARAGFVIRMGASGAGVTVNIARLLVALLGLSAPLVTTTVKLAPESAEMAAGMERAASVAPPMLTPFFLH
jgi:hypothetical protein